MEAQSLKKADRSDFNFAWEGGLPDYKAQYSSVELQHLSTEWR